MKEGRYESTSRKCCTPRRPTPQAGAPACRAALTAVLEVKLASRPGSPGTGTNPEQLFAAGWSACFDSAMEFAARNMKIHAAGRSRGRRRDRSRSRRGWLQPGGSPLREPAGDGSRDRRSALSRRPTRCVPIRGATHGNIAVENHAGLRPAPMRAESERLISVHTARGEEP